MKAILLAGGNGTRLNPLTKATSKQLLPVYNKPMIYYPLSILMLGGLTDILIITTPERQNDFIKVLGDGSQWGINLSYATQEKANGLAEAFMIAEDFIAGDACALMLGDNFLYTDGLQGLVHTAKSKNTGATIMGYHVADPTPYGVIEFDTQNPLSKNDVHAPNYPVLSIEEKPRKPKSNYAAIGLYFYDNTVLAKAKSLAPSARGELEITDLNNLYLNEGTLSALTIGRGAAWFDMGSFSDLLEAGQFVRTIEKHQGVQIANLDEIAEHMGYVKPKVA